ncbi:hypothetical protein FJZ31_32585 [Candidatus Poribacteria bacterium]|nr:hypothetical protein [Candidatus Poribacteria bacterium]
MKELKKQLNSPSIQDISVHGVHGLSGCSSACESSCFEVGGRACQIDCAVDDDYEVKLTGGPMYTMRRQA